MRAFKRRAYWRLVTLAAGGTTFFLSGCDDELRDTVEDGIITLSTSLLSAMATALMELSEEASETARALTELGPIFA